MNRYLELSHSHKPYRLCLVLQSVYYIHIYIYISDVASREDERKIHKYNHAQSCSYSV